MVEPINEIIQSTVVSPALDLEPELKKLAGQTGRLDGPNTEPELKKSGWLTQKLGRCFKPQGRPERTGWPNRRLDALDTKVVQKKIDWLNWLDTLKIKPDLKNRLAGPEATCLKHQTRPGE